MYQSFDFDDIKFEDFPEKFERLRGKNIELHETTCSLYGGAMDIYLKIKHRYQACIIYEELVKDPEVKTQQTI